MTSVISSNNFLPAVNQDPILHKNHSTLYILLLVVLFYHQYDNSRHLMQWMPRETRQMLMTQDTSSIANENLFSQVLFACLVLPVPAPVPRCSPWIIINKLVEWTSLWYAIPSHREKYWEILWEESWFPITALETRFCEVDPRKSKIISWCWTKNEKDNDSGSGIPVWPTRCCEVSAANSTSSLPQKTSALNHPLFWISYQQGGTIIADCLQKWPMNFFGPKKDQKGLSMDSEQKCCLLTKDTWFLPPKVAK